MSASDILTLSHVQTQIGKFRILHDVDFGVPHGRASVILGRNGAGKTTTLRTIMGLARASAGTIAFDGKDITQASTEEIARLGIGYVPENMGVFAGLTVHENMLVAARQGPLDRDRLDWVFSRFPPLQTFWNMPAGNLSGGQKQMLAIARAVIEPRRLLLVDEPSKGLAPAIVQGLINTINELKGLSTIVLVEQNLHMASLVADDVVVIEDGCTRYRGSMSGFLSRADLQHQLLGLSLEPVPATNSG